MVSLLTSPQTSNHFGFVGVGGYEQEDYGLSMDLFSNILVTKSKTKVTDRKVIVAQRNAGAIVTKLSNCVHCLGRGNFEEEEKEQVVAPTYHFKVSFNFYRWCQFATLL